MLRMKTTLFWNFKSKSLWTHKVSERNSLVFFTIENNPCLELKVNVLAKPTKYGMHQNNATYVSDETKQNAQPTL